jgi:hypothetical protein
MDTPRRLDDERRSRRTWQTDPETVDGYQFGGLPWPVETTRHAYLTVLGGFSQELPEDAIGLHQQALEENTDLEPGDVVTVNVVDGGQPVSYIRRPRYRLVPLGFETPDAFVNATEGQAVLPADAVEEPPAGLEKLDGEAEVVINGVIAARMRQSGS